MSDQVRLVQDYLLSRDPARFFGDDAVLEEVLGGGVWRGWEAIDAWHRRASPHVVLEGQIELVRLIDAGSTVAAEVMVVGAHRVTRETVRLPMLGIYELAAGSIQRARLYFDSARLERTTEARASASPP